MTSTGDYGSSELDSCGIGRIWYKQ